MRGACPSDDFMPSTCLEDSARGERMGGLGDKSQEEPG